MEAFIMRIGSIVRLSRPWENGEIYKDSIGIVESAEETTFSNYDSCRVRIENPRDGCAHYGFTCLKHRFDVLKE